MSDANGTTRSRRGVRGVLVSALVVAASVTGLGSSAPTVAHATHQCDFRSNGVKSDGYGTWKRPDGTSVTASSCSDAQGVTPWVACVENTGITCNTWAYFVNSVGRTVTICPAAQSDLGQFSVLPADGGDPMPYFFCSTVRRISSNWTTTVKPAVAADARAVLSNLTMTDGVTPGYISADRCSVLTRAPQTKSSGNFGTAAIANLSVVPLDTDGTFCVYNSTEVNLVADVQGYFGPGTGGQSFTASAPTRVLDTRAAPLTTPVAGTVTRVSTGVAAGTTAVLANLTMVGALGSGYITADKCSALTGGPQTKSSGNFSSAQAIANLAVVPVDNDGSFCIYNSTAVNELVDIQGTFAPTGSSKFALSAPTRVLDTRAAGRTSPAAGTITKVDPPAGVAGAAALLVNLTMVDGAGPGFITADRCSTLTAGAQTKSSGNHGTIDAIANLAVIPVDADGSFCIYNQQPVNLVVDVQGAFSATGELSFFPVAPKRVLDTR